MRRLQSTALVTTLGLSLAIAPTAQAKAKVTKPSAPTISAISSSAVKKGKVNVTVTITLPASNGGSKITGSKVTAGGKSCTIAKTKTSCTIKSIKNGKSLSVSANSKNIKGFGAKSNRVAYSAGARAWTTTPVATVVAEIPAAAAPAPVAAPAPLTCATGGTCVVGNTGPGGGIIFYVNNAGFNCGSGFTETGSPTGGLCKYLEVTPSRWYNTDADPAIRWTLPDFYQQNVIGIEETTSDQEILATSQIGLGYKNSLAILAQGNDATTAAGAARAHLGGSKNDWYLPTVAELTLLCQWNKGVTQNLTVECGFGPLNSNALGAGAAGFGGGWYATSSERTNDRIYDFSITNDRSYFATDTKASVSVTPERVRPIRAF